MRTKYRKYILLQCVFTLCIFLLLQYFFVRYDSNRLEYELSSIGQALSHTIKGNIDSSIGVLTSLGYNLEIEENLTKEKFSILSAHYIRQYPEIIYIQHKNSETITDMVFPEKEYAYTLGATLKGRKEVEDAVMKAVRERQITANDPYILKNTKDLLGLVIRYPIYKHDRFEGFFVVVIDVNHFLNSIISEQITEDYNVSFYDSKDNLIWGSLDEKCTHTYHTNIQFLNNSWRLRITHKEPIVSSTLLFIAGSAVVFIIIIALLIYVQVNFYKRDSNIDHLTNLKNELEEIQERYAIALDSANDALWEWNIATGEVFSSEKWLDITGHEMNGESFGGILQKEAIHPDDYEKAAKELEACLMGESFYYQNEYRVQDGNGNYRWVLNRGKVFNDEEGKPALMTGSVMDIDDRKKEEAKIEYMAYYDTITGLPNKALFIEKLHNAIERSKGLNNQTTILMLDLDNFKAFNDTLGLDYCDKLLKHIGETLERTAGDMALTARFGGDEFLIMHTGLKDKSEAEVLCKKILDIFNQPFEIDEKTVYITASIGVVFHPEQPCTVSEALRNADTALNKAKATGKNRYCFYDDSMYQSILRRTRMEAGLRKAIDNGELYLNYQLQQDLRTGKTGGIEVLARWRSSELGMVSPAEFITLAEDTKLIIPLGNWILFKACQQGRAWLDKGYLFGRLAVNISTVQLLSSDFFTTVTEALKSTGFPAEYLELEITESIMLHSTENNIKLLRNIKSLGVNIALDDFGTGYSSLNYLTVMPINTLKIDKSFIDKACDSELGQQITNTIIKLAHDMGLDVTAEGIESENQVWLMKQMDCDKIQGYFFARPLSAEESEKRLMG